LLTVSERGAKLTELAKLTALGELAWFGLGLASVRVGCWCWCWCWC
jgi:hypothetical protein